MEVTDVIDVPIRPCCSTVEKSTELSPQDINSMGTFRRSRMRCVQAKVRYMIRRVSGPGGVVSAIRATDRREGNTNQSLEKTFN